MGLPGQGQHPKVQDAMQRIADCVSQSEAALGLMVRNSETALEWKEKGARFIAIALESVLGPATKNYLSQVRN